MKITTAMMRALEQLQLCEQRGVIVTARSGISIQTIIALEARELVRWRVKPFGIDELELTDAGRELLK